MRIYTFEGIDGVGKTTLVEHVAQALSRQYDVTVLREPGSTPTGEAIRDILKSSLDISPSTELLLFLASRTQMVEALLPTLNSDIVIIDRYQDSTIAYQGYGNGHDIDQLTLLLKTTGTDIHIDKTFYIEAPDDLIAQRTKDRSVDTRFEKIEFQKRVKTGYNALKMQYPTRIETITNIDLETSVATILSHIERNMNN